jgi:hypothetical protein
MEVYVLTDNAIAQGTAFYLTVDNQNTVVAAYHLLKYLNVDPSSAQVYLARESWFEPVTITGVDPSNDLMFLSVPKELDRVTPLHLAKNITTNETLYGERYIDTQGMLPPFRANLYYTGPVTEIMPNGSWSLEFDGYALYGGDIYPGDSGSPLLTPDGNVAGMTVAGGNGEILAIPAATIRQDLIKMGGNDHVS